MKSRVGNCSQITLKVCKLLVIVVTEIWCIVASNSFSDRSRWKTGFLFIFGGLRILCFCHFGRLFYETTQNGLPKKRYPSLFLRYHIIFAVDQWIQDFLKQSGFLI